MPDNLWALVAPSFHKYKNHPGWICRGKNHKRVVTYTQLYDAILSTAHKLRQCGIGRHDTVGITAPNGPEWTVAAFAAWKLGANVAPIHIGNSDHDIRMQVKAVSPKIMLTCQSRIQYPDSMTDCMEISMQSDHVAVKKESAMDIVGQPDDTAVRIYTSGSTGNPKVVRLSHNNHGSNVLAVCNLMKFTRRDRFISLLPLSHAMGLTANLLLPLYCGSTLVAPRVLAAGEILDTLAQENITVVVAVPRLFRNIMLGLEKKFSNAGKGLQIYLTILRSSPLFLRKYLNAPIRKKLGGRIKVWVSGGSHLDGRISRYYHDLGLPIRQGYGLTETSPLTSVQGSFDTEFASVGKPVEHVAVKIHNPDENGNGEVWIKGPNVMLGYEDEGQNADVFENGWFKTGDIARQDHAGRITLTGRSKRLIVTEAGKNVYPEELEVLLERHSGVQEAGVFELDMKPVCVLAVEGDNPQTVAKQVLKEFNALVSAHNQITRFAIADELPRTPLGKMALQALPAVFKNCEIR